MKRLYLFAVAGLLAVVSLVGLAKIASAQSIRAGDTITMSRNQKLYDTLYLAGRTIDVDSEVFGDVFCAGQNITVSGVVHGDVICAGQTVLVSGTVDGDVRLAGQTVTLDANVAGSATIGGQTFLLTSKGGVGRDLTIGSADTTLHGNIGRDVVMGSGTAIVDSTVGRNIKAEAENLRLTSDARVQGNIDLTSRQDLRKDSGAVVTGKVTHTTPTQDQSKSKHGALFGFSVMWFLYWLLALLLLALAIVLLFPRLLVKVTDRALPNPLKAFLTGLVASMLAPVVVVLLAASVIGLPLAGLVGVAWLLALMLSGPFFGFYLGRIILQQPATPLVTMLVGTGVLAVLYFIPILGIVALLAAVWMGTGMLLLQLYRAMAKPATATASAKKK